VIDDEVPRRLRAPGGLLRELRQVVSPGRLTERGTRSEKVGVRIAVVGALIDGVAIPRRQLPDLDVVERRQRREMARRVRGITLSLGDSGG
jgi:hypothetical protein